MFYDFTFSQEPPVVLFERSLIIGKVGPILSERHILDIRDGCSAVHLGCKMNMNKSLVYIYIYIGGLGELIRLVRPP